MAIVIENNIESIVRSIFWQLDIVAWVENLYVVNFSKLNSNYKMGIFKATVIEPLFQLINHINMGQDTRDMANLLLYLAVHNG